MKTLSRWLKWSLLAIAGLFFLWQVWLLAWVLLWSWVNPGETRFMEIRLAELRQKNPQAQLKQQWVPYERISPHLKRAIIAAEDAKFVDHEGFDWEGMQKALEKNQKKGRFVAGGSTISQQLAKNLFLSSKRTPWRKLEEALITVMLEAVMDKRRIFEIYLNVIEWGDGVFGAEAAAEGVEPGGQGRGHGPIIPPPGAFASPRGQRGRPRRPVVSSRRVYLRGMLIAAV